MSEWFESGEATNWISKSNIYEMPLSTCISIILLYPIWCQADWPIRILDKYFRGFCWWKSFPNYGDDGEQILWPVVVIRMVVTTTIIHWSGIIVVVGWSPNTFVQSFLCACVFYVCVCVCVFRSFSLYHLHCCPCLRINPDRYQSLMIT